jgi:hypothetical protein
MYLGVGAFAHDVRFERNKFAFLDGVLGTQITGLE